MSLLLHNHSKSFTRHQVSETDPALDLQIKKHKKSVWRLVLLFFIITTLLMAASILFLKYPKLDRFPTATAFLLCFASGAFFMATLVCLKLAIKEVYNSQYGLTILIVAFSLCLASCKKDDEYRGATQCFVCNDPNGNELNVICAPSEDSAFNIANSACPGGCGLTMEQFQHKCPHQ